MICAKHGIAMDVTDEGRERPYKAPLRRCRICTDQFRAAFAKATRVRQRHPPNLVQRVLPPVVMSERWP